MTIASNKLSQSKDVAGSRNHDSSLNISEESLKLGAPIAGQSGVSASIAGTVPNIVVSGLSGLTAASTCRFLTLSEAASGANNGTFQITEVLSSTSAIIFNPSGVSLDSNNGFIHWAERGSYSLEDDLNYERSDRANIKGVDYDQPIPTYVRCIDQTDPIPANLANLAGKTTDAKAFVDNLRFESLVVSPGNNFITLNSPGNLKHADVVNITGVPIHDGYDENNNEATFVAILEYDGYGTELTVLQDQIGGAEAGWRIYGRARAGAANSPNAIEIEFRAVPLGFDLGASVPYIWEIGQPSIINVIIGYRTCLNDLSEAAFRKLLLFGILYGGAGSGSSVVIEGGCTQATDYGQLCMSANGVTFAPETPIVNNEGLIMVDYNGKIVVVGL